MAETTKAMTLDDVMKLEGRTLNEAVAERLGLVRGADFGEWPEHDWKRTESGEVDRHAFEVENHNGPSCRRCYYGYCEWCLKEPEERCTVDAPDYATDWRDAMQVREWGRDSSRWAEFLDALQRVIDERPGWLPSDSIDYLMWFEPIDLCRAALLVSP